MTAIQLSVSGSHRLARTRLHCSLGRRTGLILAVLLLWVSSAAMVRAQAPVPGAPPAQAQPVGLPGAGLITGDVEMRLHFVLIDQLSYTVHPFFQITEHQGFSNGKATTSHSLSTGTRDVDQEANLLKQAIHSLPPFGIEGVMGVDLPFPRGLGVGFDYSPLVQVDTNAAEGVPTVIPIRMGAFFYSGSLRFYFFNPTEGGVNYFVGLGLGLIEGTIKAEPFAGVPVKYINFSQNPVGSTRLGLEARGDNWGFRYELIVINADDVELQSNPYPDLAGDGPNPTTISFSGSLVRLNLFVQF